MLSLKLNLLPITKKTRLNHLVHFLFIKEILEIIILTCSLLAIMFLVGWLVLANALNDLAASTLLVNKEFPKNNQEIKQINKVIINFNSSAKDFRPLSPLILDLAKILPTDIQLNALSLSRNDQTVEISGVAKTREALLSYLEIIKTVSSLENVTSKATLLFQRENISFDLSARLKNTPK